MQVFSIFLWNRFVEGSLFPEWNRESRKGMNFSQVSWLTFQKNCIAFENICVAFGEIKPLQDCRCCRHCSACRRRWSGTKCFGKEIDDARKYAVEHTGRLGRKSFPSLIFFCYSKASRFTASSWTNLDNARFWIGSKKIWDAWIFVAKTLSCTVFWCFCLCLIK